MDMPAAPPIPVFLVTGFLGSGKTTLIAALLRQPAMAGTAIVVNEFGAVGIDDAIFAEAVDPGQVLLLANGCLCCTASDDLAATVWSVTQREADRVQRIVIETTGLADPVPVIMRLMADTRLQGAIRLAGVIATLDAVNGPAQLDREPVALRQAAVADRRIITKADIAGDAAARSLADRLRLLNPGAPIEVVSHGAMAAGDLLDAALFDPFARRSDPAAWIGVDAYRQAPLHARRKATTFGDMGNGAAAVSTWLVEEARPMDWTKLSPRLATIIGRHGDVVLRLKGMIRTANDPHPLVLHSVQRLFHPPMRLSRSGDNDRSSIVVIGTQGAEVAVVAIEGAMAEAAVG